MAITFVGVSSNSVETTGGNVIVTKPAGVQDGDRLFAIATVEQPLPMVTVPAGWTLVAEITDPTQRGHLYTKVASGEPANWTWNRTNGFIVSVAAYRGNGIAIDVVGTIYNNASNGDVMTNGLTPTKNGLLLMVGWVNNSNSNSTTPPAGFTERLDTGSNDYSGVGGDSCGTFLAELAQAPGTVTAKTAVSPSSALGTSGLLIQIYEAAVGLSGNPLFFGTNH
jgi:hypothetical protein